MSNSKVRFLKKQKQEIIDQYLAETGASGLVVDDFLNYIETHGDHPFHKTLFGKGADYYARQGRLQMLREMISGCRTTLLVIEPAKQVEAKETTVEVETPEQKPSVSMKTPSFISTRSTRHKGGGYNLSVSDGDAYWRELSGQAADRLESWLDSFAGIISKADVDVDGVKSAIVALRTYESEPAVTKEKTVVTQPADNRH